MPQIGGGQTQQDDPLGTIIQLMQVLDAQRTHQAQIGLEKAQQGQAALQLLAGLAQHTTKPEQLFGVADDLARRYGFEPGTVRQFVSAIPAAVQTWKDQTTGEGVSAMGTPARSSFNTESANTNVLGQTGSQVAVSNFLEQQLGGIAGTPAGQQLLGPEAVFHMLTGGGQGQAALSAATAGLGAGKLQQAAEIGTGLAASVPQQMSNATARAGQSLDFAASMANIRLGERRLESESALQQMGYAVQLQIAGMQAGARGQPTPAEYVAAVNAQSELITNLQAGKYASPAAQQQAASALQGLNTFISSTPWAPTAAPQINPGTDYRQFSEPGLFSRQQPLQMQPSAGALQQGAQQFTPGAGVVFPFASPFLRRR